MRDERFKLIIDNNEGHLINIWLDGAKPTYSAEKVTEWLNNLNEENKQLREQVKIYEKFLDGNDLDIEWVNFCTVDECEVFDEEFDCKDCKYMRWTDD